MCICFFPFFFKMEKKKLLACLLAYYLDKARLLCLNRQTATRFIFWSLYTQMDEVILVVGLFIAANFIECISCILWVGISVTSWQWWWLTVANELLAITNLTKPEKERKQDETNLTLDIRSELLLMRCQLLRCIRLIIVLDSQYKVFSSSQESTMLIRAYGANQCFIQMYTSGQNKMEKGKKIKFSVELNANWFFLWLCSLGWDLFIFFCLFICLFVYLFFFFILNMMMLRIQIHNT